MGKPPSTSVRRAGRPRAFDRDQALDIALDLFWRQGFEGTSTAQLTQAMGISQPSLYAAFGSKEALFREILALYEERYSSFMLDGLARKVPARDALLSVLLGAAQQFADTRHALGCMVASGGLEGGAGSAHVFRLLADMRLKAQAAIQQRLEQAQRDGDLPPTASVTTLAAYFALVIQGMSVQARDGASPALLQTVAELAMAAWPLQ